MILPAKFLKISNWIWISNLEKRSGSLLPIWSRAFLPDKSVAN